MKTFKIKSTHTINIDSWEEGELEEVNYYEVDSTIEAENAKEAILKYFDNILFFDFDFKLAGVETTHICYDVLVNSDNEEIKQNDIDFTLWKEGKVTLYNNHVQVFVEEFVPVCF